MSVDLEARRRKARRTIALLVLVCAAPVVASYVAYYGLHRQSHVNYGEMLETRPAPAIAGAANGVPWTLQSLRGRWILLVLVDGACDARCERALYATRQARTIQGREQERIDRVVLQPSGATPPPAALLARHPGLIAAQGDPQQWRPLLPGGESDSIYIVDPLGNLVLRYPADPDIKGLAKDLDRLLRASRIG